MSEMGYDNPYPPEYLEMLAQMGVSESQIAEIRERMGRAEEMRDAPGPEGREAGGTYVAANPLEHIANLVGKYRGGKAMQQGRRDMDIEMASQQGRIGRVMADYSNREAGGAPMSTRPQPYPGAAPQAPFNPALEAQKLKAMQLRRGM